MKQFTDNELRAMIKEYPNTSKMRQEMLNVWWEIAKEMYLNGLSKGNLQDFQKQCRD